MSATRILVGDAGGQRLQQHKRRGLRHPRGKHEQIDLTEELPFLLPLDASPQHQIGTELGRRQFNHPFRLDGNRRPGQNNFFRVPLIQGWLK